MGNEVQVDPAAFASALKGQRDRALDEAAMFSAAVEILQARNDALEKEVAELRAKLKPDGT